MSVKELMGFKYYCGKKSLIIQIDFVIHVQQQPSLILLSGVGYMDQMTS